MNTTPAPAPKRGGLFYGWYIALSGAASNFLILAVTLFGFGVFIGEFREEFGWSVKAIALGISIRSLEQGVLSPFTGYLVDRFGPRRMSVMSMVIIALSLFMFSQVRHLPVYYAASAVMAFGQSLGGFTTFSTALMAWFHRKRGKAVGMIYAGNGLGYLGALIVATMVGAMGWRGALVGLGLVIVIVGIPLSLLIRDRPEPYGYSPDGEPPEPPASGSSPGELPIATGMEVREALHTPAFYLLVLATAFGGAIHGPWAVFSVPHYQAVGFSTATAGALVAAYGLFQVPLRLLLGPLGDRYGRRRMYILGFFLAPIGMGCVSYVSPDRLWLLIPFYLFFGAGHALWGMGNHTVIADYFGTKRFATIRGLSQGLQLPVAIVAPLFVGAIFDQSGSYRPAFLALAAFQGAGAIWVLLIRRPLWKDMEASRRTPLAPPAPSAVP